MAEYISFQPSDFFNTLLWTGDGSASRSLTGVGFQPDFTWIKPRSTTIEHNLYDSPRGATWALQSNNDEAQGQNNGYGWLSAFDADGFTVVEGGSNASRVNDNTVTYVGWNWKGGTTSGITTNGSTTITPSAYSFSATAGISILKYEGNGTSAAKLAHGLGVAPQQIILKRYEAAENWGGYNIGVDATAPEDYGMAINTTGARDDDASYWNDTKPDTVNITLGNGGRTNESGEDFVAYVFAPVKGFSKFGGYTGNGNADGTFVYTGFRPAFLILRRTDSGGDWFCWDNKRGPYNVNTPLLVPNAVTAETSTAIPDFLSNGFKLRSTNVDANASGGTYIYMAFAEFPIVSSNDVPTVAR